MKPRKKKHNIIWRTLFTDIPVEGGGYKAKFSPAKLAIVMVIIVGSLVVLQITGTLQTLGKIISSIVG